ncbi:unnamed protein product [Microthlaspi erraticum]|uniref:Uncharacterized protein n=1 Tax=Microthlaspi erraticum TaxID=1685480 RepID=A0A6D2K5Q6_9BRAS|nr:unnamed protein product [Microthlaspi erraticum]
MHDAAAYFPANAAKRWSSSHIYTLACRSFKLSDYPTSKFYELNIKKVKNILVTHKDDPVKILEMIDVIQGLGVDVHFKQEIDQTLHMIYQECARAQTYGYHDRDLSEVALCFRLLRQEGHYVQESMFESIRDKRGGFKDELRNDVKGLIELYEASELGLEGEETLDGAKEFAFNRLNELCSGQESHQQRKIMSSLRQPRHKTLQRLSSKNLIDMIKVASREDDEWLQSLLRVVEIDSVMLNSLIQEEISTTFKWWRELGLEKELWKARKQPLKWHTWSMAILQDPTLSEQRLDLTKKISLVYVIDDIFDVYGGLEELTVFTRAVERDIEGLEKLTRYMKVCFEALNTITEEISMKILKSHGWNPTDSLRKSEKQSGLTRIMSSGVHLVMLHVYFLLRKDLNQEKVELIESNPKIVSSAATILRLWDDLGSAKDENQDGYDGSYVECYLNEHKGSTVDEARTHVVQKISKAWKCLNRECLNPRPFSRSFSNACLNIARTVPMMYSYDEDQKLPGLDEYIKSHLTISD